MSGDSQSVMVRWWVSGVGQAVSVGQRSPSSGSDKHIPSWGCQYIHQCLGLLKSKCMLYLIYLFLFILYFLLVLTFALIHWTDTLSDMWVFVQLTSTKSITRQWSTNMDFSVTDANNWIAIDYTQLQEKLCEHLRFAENVGMWCGFTIHFCINWI